MYSRVSLGPVSSLQNSLLNVPLTWIRTGLYYPVLNWIIDSFPGFIVERLQPGLRGLQEVSSAFLFSRWICPR